MRNNIITTREWRFTFPSVVGGLNWYWRTWGLTGFLGSLQHNSAWEPCRTHDDVGRRSLYRVNLSLELNIVDETPLPRTSTPFNLSWTLESQIFFFTTLDADNLPHLVGDACLHKCESEVHSTCVVNSLDEFANVDKAKSTSPNVTNDLTDSGLFRIRFQSVIFDSTNLVTRIFAKLSIYLYYISQGGAAMVSPLEFT